MISHDVVLKRSQPLRVAEASAVAPGGGPENVAPIFARLVPRVLDVLKSNGIDPGMSVGHYEESTSEGGLVVHVGFEISPHETITDVNGVTVVDLPVVEVASLTHYGALDTLLDSNAQLAQWITDSGHTASGASRELYLQFDDDDPTRNITEVQAVLSR